MGPKSGWRAVTRFSEYTFEPIGNGKYLVTCVLGKKSRTGQTWEGRIVGGLKIGKCLEIVIIRDERKFSMFTCPILELDYL